MEVNDFVSTDCGQSYFQMELIRLATRRIVASCVPGNQDILAPKGAKIVSLYCQAFGLKSSQKKYYKHVVLEFSLTMWSTFNSAET